VNLTKQVKAAHLAVEDNSPNLPLAKLTSLKLRLTSITGAHIHELLALTPRLSRLDLSFTKVRRLASSGLDNLAIPPLEKLVLTSTPVDIAELLAIISDLPRLKKLHLGGLGAQQGRNQEVSALTLTDARLMELTDVLSENCLEIEDINLAQNAKLGSRFGSRTHADALLFFVRQVGRYCKVCLMCSAIRNCSLDTLQKLNLSGTSLRSSDLDGLLPVLLDPMPVMKNPNHVPSDPPRLEVIVLNNTKVDDEAAEALSACKNLEILELSGTSMLSVSLRS
jgi:Leucine-rich repeat (LRR) protein